MKFVSALAATSAILGAAVAVPPSSKDAFYLKINGGDFNGKYVGREGVDKAYKAVATEDHGEGYNLISNNIVSFENGALLRCSCPLWIPQQGSRFLSI